VTIPPQLLANPQPIHPLAPASDSVSLRPVRS